MNNTVNRIKAYIDFKNLSVRKFEEKVGFSNGAFASQYKNNKSIGVDKVEDILHEFPDLNPTWLLTGEGEMLLPNSDTKKAAPDQERLYIEQRVEKLEQEIRELSSLTASLRKTIQGLIEEMNELKQGASKQVSSKSSKDAG